MVILFQENKSLQLNFIAEIISDIYMDIWITNEMPVFVL
jgi:hypothetical protein